MQTRRKGSKEQSLSKRKEKTRASLRVAARRVGRVAKTTDRYSRPEVPEHLLLSIFLGLVDTRRRGLHYINAGHIPPIVVRANGEVLKLEEGGTVIGLFDAAEYKRASLKLLPGDVLLCCTDGITKAQNAEKEEFGLERLVEVARAHRHLSAQQIVDKVARQVSSFAGDGTHLDDKVLMVLKLLKDS